jgi:hypothetical protein
VITESIARKYFGEEDAVRVVGVVEDVPQNAHFHCRLSCWPALSSFIHSWLISRKKNSASARNRS